MQCHLCGGWFRSVLAHLRVHGWDQLTYRTAFELERSQPLEGDVTRRRRAAALTVRRRTDPAVRDGCAIGQERARSGELTLAALAATRGRRQPEQRRRKTLRTLASISPAARAAGSRRHAEERLRRTAAAAAARLGHPDLGSAVLDRVAAGHSLAAVSRAAGLHKDWLCRHLATVDPATATAIATGPALHRQDARWLPVVRALGFDDVASYLTDRHVAHRMTVRAIAIAVGLSPSAVGTALRRHGMDRVPHAAARGASRDRADAIARAAGHASFASYLTDRRAAGLSWRAIAADCGMPATWVRRRAGLPG
ncbi:hypothetical protein [Pseudonocardia sp. GCM10023141]|uniref:hypothetical protein n=1 Tax=Pseudonocardia sp. GCM10023141 TaxID=3252653 RepID=UPI003612FFC9